MGCNPPTVPATVKIPLCGEGPPHSWHLDADQTLSGTLTLYAYGAPVPAGMVFTQHPILTLLLAIALPGLTLRRRSARGLALPLLFILSLAAAFSISACGTAPQGFTPGTYHYTVTAAQVGSPSPRQEGANATVTIH